MTRARVVAATFALAALIGAASTVPVQPQRDRRTGSIGWWPCPSRHQLHPRALEDTGSPTWISLATMWGGWCFPYRSTDGNREARYRLRGDLWALQVGLVGLGLAAGLVAAQRRWRTPTRGRASRRPEGPGAATVTVSLLGLAALYGTLLAAPVRLHSGLFRPPAESLATVRHWLHEEIELLPLWLAVERHDGGPVGNGKHLAWEFRVEWPWLCAVQMPLLVAVGLLATWAVRRDRCKHAIELG